jgi:signal transduction histidine kinase/CheY-like chemotaxis protein
MKTTNDYMKYGIFFLILFLVFCEVANGFSGIGALLFVKYLFYSLSLYKYSSIIFFILLTIAILLILFGVKSSHIFSKVTGKRLNFADIHYFGAENNAMMFMAEPEVSVKKSVTKTNANSSHETNKATDERAVVLVDAGCIMFANKTFFKLTGYEPLDVLGKDFASFILPDSLLNFTMLKRQKHHDTQNSGSFGIRTLNNNNIVAFIGESKHSNYDPKGLNAFCLKQVTQTKKKGESYLDALFFESIENVDALHWIWDDKGIIYLNNSCRKNLPFSLGLILDKPGLMLKSVSKNDRGTIRKALDEYAKTGKFNEEICCLQQDGSKKYFRVIITPQPENNSFPERNHAIAYDITDEKLTLINACNAAQRAEIANKNKTAFLANMSHEIRSPLNGIIGFSELLADKDLTDAERERYLYIIQNNGNALITLLSDLIDISKLESGNLTILNRKFHPAKLIEELRCHFEGPAIRKQENVRLVFNNTNSFKDIEIDTDSNRLRQILVNLITNSIKFTTKGKIEIGADFLGDEMVFWVKDSGIGISEENQSAIFERFRQVDAPESSTAIGFGLGLAITKALVGLLGGKIWVESIPDKGSLFVFTIKTNIAVPNMETDLKTSPESQNFDFSQHTILIAEDNDDSFQYLDALLKKTCAKIVWAKNGQEAIDLALSNPNIDMVLMDMHMPVMDGYEASAKLTKLRPGLPIIAQTAFVINADIEKSYASGCLCVIAKPFRRNILFETLIECFEKASQSRF